ncbi:MAG TPA: ribbon-helix-helix protein, CopG family [Thermoanaerobaculia bacterium]|nr:ribbon-helix-helix protein, CopG family [Thermoanaerobaculia bacterium]
MSSTITFRTDDALRRELEERAAAAGKSVSELIREILESAVHLGPLEERAGHLRGRLSLPRRDDEPWRRQLRERNWRR